MATQNKKLTDTQKSFFDRTYGGIDSYIDNQQKRYDQALQSGDTELLNRLQADADRVGYVFDRTQQETPNNTVKTTGTAGLESEIRANKNPTIFNEGQLQNAINAIGGAGRANTFNLAQLQQAIQAASQAGQNPTTREAKYNSPEGIGNLITQMNQLLQPLTQAQQQAAQSGFNQQMSRGRDRLAASGLLASGAAGAAEQQGANQLAQQLAGIEAANQANAIIHAFNAANLDLAEDQQIFGQQANVRDFDAQQAQNLVGNLLAGHGVQQSQNQFDLNRQLAQTGAMMDAMGMQHGFNQDYIGNLTNVADMNMRQNQFDTSAMLDMIRMFGGIPGNNMGNFMNTGVAGGANTSNLFAPFQGMQTLDARRQQEDQRQFDINAATNLTDLFGRTVMPNSDPSGLFGQVEGQETFPARRWLQEFQANENYREKALALDRARQQTDANYKRFLQEQGKTEEQGRRATNGYMVKLMEFDDPKKAMEYLVDNIEHVANDGAHVGGLLDMFKYLWPNTQEQGNQPAPWDFWGAANQ